MKATEMESQVYVLTGATSFIASGILRKLMAEGKRVYALCRPGSKRLDRIPASENIRLIDCELSELEKAAKEIPEPCHVFFHLGWHTSEKNDMYLQNLNVTYTLDAVKLAKALGCHTFIGMGSQAEYGLANVKLTDRTPCFPVSGYGMAKLCGGQMSRKLCEDLGVRHIWARLLSVYGSMDAPTTMIMSVIAELLQGREPRLTKGEQIWDFLYIEDCADALFRLSEYGKAYETYVIGSGEERTLRSYGEEIREIVNPRLSMKFGEVPYNRASPMYLSADMTKMERDTGFKPRTNFRDGIMDIVEKLKIYG